MFPIHNFTTLNPENRSQMASTKYYPHHPNYEGNNHLPPQMTTEPPIPTTMLHPQWPHYYGYPVPSPSHYHSCCSHSSHPGYYAFRPPYPHFPPSAHSQFCGGYSVHADPCCYSYPVQYTPPPHHMSNIPRYEHEKGVPKEYHCCGCPQHMSGTKGDKILKIEEEEEPEVQKEDSRASAPARFQNTRYPIIWIPPDHMKGEQQRSPAERKQVEDYNGGSRALRSRQDSKIGSGQEQAGWNGWLPLDMENLGRLMAAADGKRDEGSEKRTRIRPIEEEVEDNHKGVGQNLHGPSQSVSTVGSKPNEWSGWLPLDVESLRRLMRTANGERDVGSDKRSQIRPIAEEAGDNHKEGGQNLHDPSSQSARTVGSKPDEWSGWLPLDVDTIKRLLQQQDGKNSQDEHAKDQNGDGRKAISDVVPNEKKEEERPAEKKGMRTIPVKQVEVPYDIPIKKQVEKKEDDEVTETQSKRPSPPRASKLPPVCLRVDPLPKRNGRGSSRSPSPPGHKDQQVEAKKATSSVSEGQVKEVESKSKPSTDRDEQSQRVEANNVDLTGKTVCKDAKEPCSHQLIADEEREKSKKKIVETTVDKAKEGGMEEGKGTEEINKPEKKILSGAEAATLIQSAFRGYGVRRWEPLKKLKQIAKVRKEVAKVRESVEDLQFWRGSVDRIKKLALGETIMKLLLELDTILGLNPSVRAARKSAASELVCLQEKLDSISIEQAEPTSKDETAPETPWNSNISDELSREGEKQSEVLNQQSCPNLSEVAMGNSEELDVCLPDSGSEAEKVVGEATVTDQLGATVKSTCKDNECSFVKDANVDHALEKELAEEPETAKLLEKPTEKDSDVLAELPVEAIEEQREEAKTPRSPEQTDQDGDMMAELPVEAIEEQREEAKTPQSPEQTDQDGDLMAELPVEAVEEQAVDTKLIPESSQTEPEINLFAELPIDAVEEQPEEAKLLENHTREKQDIDLLAELPIEAVEEQSEEAKLLQNPARTNQDIDMLAELPIDAVEEQPEEAKLLQNPAGTNQDIDLLAELPTEAVEQPEKENQFRNSGETEQDINLLAELPVDAIEEQSEDVLGYSKILAAEEEHEVEHPVETQDAVTEREDDKPVELDSSNPQASKELDFKQVEEQGAERSPSQEQDELCGDDKVKEVIEATLELNKETGVETPTEKERKAEGGNEKETKAEGGNEWKRMEENERLMDLLEKLIASGKEQQKVIACLSGKVKDLEGKISSDKKDRKKKVKRARVLLPRTAGRSAKNTLRGN